MKYYLQALSNYANFTGRARRREYWMFILFNVLFSFAAFSIDILMGMAVPELGFGAIYILYALAVFIPGLAVTVRRLHDTGKSGWMYFISLIPIIGGIWLLVLLATEGDRGANQYGSDPVEVTPDEALA